MRTKEEMRDYQRKRRVNMKAPGPITEVDSVGGVVSKIPCRGCIAKDIEIEELKDLLSVVPSGSCKGCSDKDMQLKIVRAKVLMLEKELGLLKRDKKVEREDVPKSPYRLGAGV